MISSTTHDLFLAALWIFGTVVVLAVISLAVIVCGVLKEQEERRGYED